MFDFSMQVALTVLDAHLKICRDMYSRSLLTEGVKQVTSVMYSPSPEKVGKLNDAVLLTVLCHCQFLV